jgi:hypothetical protein
LGSRGTASTRGEKRAHEYRCSGSRAIRCVRLGLRENVAQFSLLVVVNAFVGAMDGMERSILPLLAGIGDVASPAWRASAIGVYRFWRDLGSRSVP